MQQTYPTSNMTDINVRDLITALRHSRLAKPETAGAYRQVEAFLKAWPPTAPAAEPIGYVQAIKDAEIRGGSGGHSTKGAERLRDARGRFARAAATTMGIVTGLTGSVLLLQLLGEAAKHARAKKQRMEREARNQQWVQQQQQRMQMHW